MNSSSASWLAPLATVISLIAAGLSIWALAKRRLTTPRETGPVLTGDPKATVCSAFQQVVTAVSLQTHTDLGQEPVPRWRWPVTPGWPFWAVVCLLSRIPAGRPELANEVRGFATSLEQIGMNYLAGVPDTDKGRSTCRLTARAPAPKIVNMCK